jgi:small conductance mechanosensitive channel
MAVIDTGNLIGNVSPQNFILFIFVVIASVILGNIANIIIRRILKSRTDPAVYKTAGRIFMYSIYFVGFYFAFQRILNFNIPAFLAALGILGITMLLTMLPVLQNIFAGIVLSIEMPYRENDIVEVDGNVCVVRDIMLRKTVLRSLDGKIIISSNMKLMSGDIINYSRGEFIRAELEIGLKKDSNYKKAIDIIDQILADNPNVLPQVPQKNMNLIQKLFVMPKNISVLEPRIFIKEVDNGKITLQVWFWIWDILRKEKTVSDFYEKLMEEFKKSKISFG